ncbi:hypothetical protein MNBD_PLANCTO02-2630 [hydrothermal vent metagenome]|uniref:DUF2752 domain-containing protein n=1 Tax=hydrothermal vent metagenome TaxID=652676 RepID=A0A3B1D916_9ZZZZ
MLRFFSPFPFKKKFSLKSEHGYPLGTVQRYLLAFWSLFLIAGFALAVSLEPSPLGYGTHQKLGLPPCSFLILFDIPCPSCGMTTSFANFVRGRFIASAQANVAGLLLALFCFLQIPWIGISFFRRRMWLIEKPDIFFLWILIFLTIICLARWGIVVYFR